MVDILDFEKVGDHGPGGTGEMVAMKLRPGTRDRVPSTITVVVRGAFLSTSHT